MVKGLKFQKGGLLERSADIPGIPETDLKENTQNWST